MCSVLSKGYQRLSVKLTKYHNNLSRLIFPFLLLHFDLVVIIALDHLFFAVSPPPQGKKETN